MLEVRLHGALAAQFGRLWHFDVQTPREAVIALECARKGFRAALLKLDQMGLVFRVRTRGHDFIEEELELNLGANQRLDIIPIVRGSSAGIRFIAGAALAFIGYGTSIFTGPMGAAVGNLGIGLMLGAVTEWLTPTPKRKEVEYNAKDSWSIAGPVNTTEQGVPVPLIYGEVLTGSVPISAGLAASDITPSGNITPAVVITGPADYVFWAGTSIGTYTLVVQLSAAPYNFAEPYTFLWTRTGFALASAVRLLQPTSATVRLELDYVITAPGQTINDSGSLNCAMTGVDNPTEGTPVNVNANKAVTTTVNSTGYESP